MLAAGGGIHAQPGGPPPGGFGRPGGGRPPMGDRRPERQEAGNSQRNTNGKKTLTGSYKITAILKDSSKQAPWPMRMWRCSRKMTVHL